MPQMLKKKEEGFIFLYYKIKVEIYNIVFSIVLEKGIEFKYLMKIQLIPVRFLQFLKRKMTNLLTEVCIYLIYLTIFSSKSKFF